MLVNTCACAPSAVFSLSFLFSSSSLLAKCRPVSTLAVAPVEPTTWQWHQAVEPTTWQWHQAVEPTTWQWHQAVEPTAWQWHQAVEPITCVWRQRLPAYGTRAHPASILRAHPASIWHASSSCAATRPFTPSCVASQAAWPRPPGCSSLLLQLLLCQTQRTPPHGTQPAGQQRQLFMSVRKPMCVTRQVRACACKGF